MATLTAAAAVASNQPKVARGPELIRRVFDYTRSATLSAGDVVILDGFLVPHGAVVSGCRLSGKTLDGTIIMVPSLRVGTTDTIMGSLTLSAATRQAVDVIGSTLPFVVSVSDDAAVRHALVFITIGTTASHTGSTSVSVILDYSMDK